MKRADRGSAVVEFTLFTIVALVPLAWAALSLQQFVVQHAAAQDAAGEALRAFLTAPSEPEGWRRADVAARLAIGESRGVRGVDVAVTCGTSPCLQPGTRVRVQVQVQSQLPAIPVLGVTPAMSTRAEQYGVVDAYVAAR